MARSQLVAMSSSEDEGSLRFIYELLGWVEETQVSLSQTFRETQPVLKSNPDCLKHFVVVWFTTVCDCFSELLGIVVWSALTGSLMRQAANRLRERISC